MMTKDEIRRYIELHGDARTVVDTIKAMKAEGIEVTEATLDERLSASSESIDEIEDFLENSPTRKGNPLKVILMAVGIGVAVAVVVSVAMILL